MLDLAANVSEGIRNTTTVFDGPQRDRVRIPRHVPFDGVLAVSEKHAIYTVYRLIFFIAVFAT